MIKKPGTHGNEHITQPKKKQRVDMTRREIAPMPTISGYCVKCKEMRPINGGASTKKNGRNMHLGGKCTKCGTGMAKILPGDKKKK